jgi:ferredoxin-NADP reductase
MAHVLTVQETFRATPRATVFRLALNGQPFAYQPGQAILVGEAGGRKRAFSLADAPERARALGFLEILVGGLMPGDPLLSVRRGDRLEVDGPVGRFAFPQAPRERQFVFIAGGTGIAPIRSMLHSALAIRGSHIVVLYSARTAEEFAYLDELTALSRAGRLSLQLTVTRAPQTDSWAGLRGRFATDRFCAGTLQAGARFFICGPRDMALDAQRGLLASGVAADRIVVEDWCRLEVVSTPAPRPFAVANGTVAAASLPR